MNNDILRFKRVLANKLRAKLGFSIEKAQEFIDSYDEETLENMVEMRMTPDEIIDEIKAERGFELSFVEGENKNMKLTKDTLIEGQIVKRGTNIRIREELDDQEYLQKRLLDDLVDAINTSPVEVFGNTNNYILEYDRREKLVIINIEDNARLLVTPYYEGDNSMEFILEDNEGDIVYDAYSQPRLVGAYEMNLEIYFEELTKFIKEREIENPEFFA